MGLTGLQLGCKVLLEAHDYVYKVQFGLSRSMGMCNLKPWPPSLSLNPKPRTLNFLSHIYIYIYIHTHTHALVY